MSVITTTELDVLVDGGSSDGRLVFADDKLAAVIVRVTATEADGADGCWFLEAGFGPCSSLQTAPPRVFASESAAIEWITTTLAAR